MAVIDWEVLRCNGKKISDLFFLFIHARSINFFTLYLSDFFFLFANILNSDSYVGASSTFFTYSNLAYMLYSSKSSFVIIDKFCNLIINHPEYSVAQHFYKN